MAYRPFVWRIGVGDPEGEHSSIYKIWAARKSADVYLLARPTGKAMKVSIHASGARQVGLTSQFVASENAQGRPVPESRHFSVWSAGRTHGGSLIAEFQLRFPTDQLRRFPIDPPPGVQWLPAAGAGHSLVVNLFVADHNASFVGEIVPTIVARGQLIDGQWVTLAMADSPISDLHEATVAQMKSLARRSGISTANVKPSHRVVVGGDHLGGPGFWCEFALDTFLG